MKKDIGRSEFNINSSMKLSDEKGCCCDCNEAYDDKKGGVFKDDINITIDGKPYTVSAAGKNVVQIIKEAGIGIPAPCYLAKERRMCCKVCVVEISGEQYYACCTKPSDGMDIIVHRADLIAFRKAKAIEYKENLKSASPGECCC